MEENYVSRINASIVDHAAENGYGIPAFNVNNLEQLRRLWKHGEMKLVRR